MAFAASTRTASSGSLIAAVARTRTWPGLASAMRSTAPWDMAVLADVRRSSSPRPMATSLITDLRIANTIRILFIAIDTRLRGAETVESGRVLDENPIARRFVRRPSRREVEQKRIVRFPRLVRVRPITAPDQPFGCGFHERLPQPDDIPIARRTVVRVVVRHRQFHPRPALVDEASHHRVCRVAASRRSWNVPDVIEYYR